MIKADKFVAYYALPSTASNDDARELFSEMDEEFARIVPEATRQIHLGLLDHGAGGMKAALRKVLADYGEAVLRAERARIKQIA